MGGINLDDVYENSCCRARLSIAASVEGADDVCWADVALRVEGPDAAALQRLFLEQWARQRGQASLPETGSLTQPDRTLMRIVGSAPGHGEPHVYVARMAEIARAQQRVWLANGCLCPRRRPLSVR